MKTFGREDLTDDLIIIGDTGEQIMPWNYKDPDVPNNVFVSLYDKKEKPETWEEAIGEREDFRRNPWGRTGEPETAKTIEQKTMIIENGTTSLSGLSFSGTEGMYVRVTDAGLAPDWLRLEDC